MSLSDWVKNIFATKAKQVPGATPGMFYLPADVDTMISKKIAYQQATASLPVVEIDEKGIVYMPKDLKMWSAGWIPGETSTQMAGNLGFDINGVGLTHNGVTYKSALEYTKKAYGTADDVLGVNNWRASRGQAPVVQYKKIQSLDLSFLPQNGGNIIFENGKIKKVTYGDGREYFRLE